MVGNANGDAWLVGNTNIKETSLLKTTINGIVTR